MSTTIILLCLAGLLVSSAQAVIQTQQLFEFENTVKTSDTEYQPRSEASGNYTLRVVDETGAKSIVFDVCVKPISGASVNFTIDDIQYVNDGISDNVTVAFNGTSFGSFSTQLNFANGFGWNTVKSSGRVGSMTEVAEGNYTMTITATTDMFGVEFDLIRLFMENQDASQDIFCGSKTFQR